MAADLHALIERAQREHCAGRLDEAASAYRQILAIRPDIAEAHNDLGTVLVLQCKLDLARACFEQAIALKPELAVAHYNLGNLLRDRSNLDEAKARFQQAIALWPDYAEAHNNLGDLLRRQDRLDEAVAAFGRAIALRPDFAEAYKNLGHTLKLQGKIDQAVPRFEQALALQPDYAEAQFGLSACYLIQGDYRRGWPAYEARLRIAKGIFEPPHLPRWAGESLAGRTLLLLAEQGLGDTLHFLRYARLLKERGARVVLAAQAALGPLLASHPDLDALYLPGSGREVPHCDFYLPLLSLPGAFGSDAQTIPCQVPYLRADPQLTEKWRAELAGIDGFKIGIAWQGARDFQLDRWRSIPLAHFAPLAALDGVRVVSLQKGFGSEQIAVVDFPVVDLSDRLDEAAGPFMDTAALIGSLDLLVTSDSAVAHLAGALGVTVWVAIGFSPEWRWMLGRDDSPWYPTMRLFRQSALDDWPGVFQRIAQAVQERRAEKG